MFGGWLKQNTSATIKLGPFVDETDGFTAEAGLTISQADVRLSKNGGNMAQKNDANAATHDEIGIYDCALNATDTDTCGSLDVFVHESGARPVRHTFLVVDDNIYEAMFSSDYFNVDVQQIKGGSTAATNAEKFFDGTGYAGTNNVIPTVTTLTGHTPQTGDSYADLADGGRLDLLIDAILADTGTAGVAIADGGITAAKIATAALDADAMAADLDTYQAKVWLFDDETGSTDRYVACWYKNGMPITAGITTPLIQVIKAADGTDLVGSVAMTQIGALGLYRYDEGANRIVDGVAYIAKVTATIGGSARTWYQPVGRDS